MSAGIIVPGISKTVILMFLGIYSTYLTAISSLNFSILIPLGVGLILGSVIFMFIINFLFSHFKSYTYFLIFGFVLGSILVIFPGFSFSFECVLGLLLAGVCFLLTYRLGRLEK
jgi:putative membrane protein